MSRRLIAPVALALVSATLFLTPARAAGPCTTTVSPGGGGIQAALSAAAPNDVVCIAGGTYTIGAPLKLPGPITIAGVGTPPPVIQCAASNYCIDASVGPSDVAIENVVLENAKKMDLQLGSTANTALVTDWTLTGITVRGAGNVGIAMNNAVNVVLSDSFISQNGSKPYGKKDHTGDFGIRASRVDSLSVVNSTFANNVVTKGANDGNAAGLKFNNDTNITVTGNTFMGNGGGGQLWADIDSDNFTFANNTVGGASNTITSEVANDAIRIEASCGGTNGGTVSNNTVAGGTTAGIDLFDTNGVQVTQNQVSIGAKSKYGIRMYGNAHEVEPASGCDTSGVYPNANNTATGNVITDTTALGSGLNGVVNDPGGDTTGNVWSANTYTRPHCSDPNWLWWDGSIEQHVGFAGWQGFGPDAAPDGGCSSTSAEIASFTPGAGAAGTVVTIQGSGLTGASAVTFNNVSSTQFNVDSDTQITATVPAGSVTGPVCVQTATRLCTTSYFIDTSGGSGSAVAVLVPSSGSPGTRVAIQGVGLAGTAGVTFASGLTSAFTVVSDTEVDATAPAGVATGPVCLQMADLSSTCSTLPFTVVKAAATKITSPFATFQLNPYPLSWKAVAGADSYQAQWRSAPYNGTYPANWTKTTTTATTLAFPTTSGQTTCFKVATQNSAGSALSGQTCTAVPLDDRGLKVGAGAWTKATAARYYQGTAMVSQAKNATLTLAGVSAKTIALVVELQPGGGSVDVLLGGKLLGTVSTAGSPVQDGQLVTVASWGALHSGTLTLRIATSGKPVAIDGVGLFRG